MRRLKRTWASSAFMLTQQSGQSGAHGHPSGTYALGLPCRATAMARALWEVVRFDRRIVVLRALGIGRTAVDVLS